MGGLSEEGHAQPTIPFYQVIINEGLAMFVWSGYDRFIWTEQEAPMRI